MAKRKSSSKATKVKTPPARIDATGLQQALRDYEDKHEQKGVVTKYQAHLRMIDKTRDFPTFAEKAGHILPFWQARHREPTAELAQHIARVLYAKCEPLREAWNREHPNAKPPRQGST